MAGPGVWPAQDRVALEGSTGQQALRIAVASSIATGAASSIATGAAGTRSFAVRHADAEEPLVADVIPIRLSECDIFPRCAAALVLTPVTTPPLPPVERVPSRFEPIPSEARIG
jgi:hypothetical protein